jgi:single-strand DNA-binding protein
MAKVTSIPKLKKVSKVKKIGAVNKVVKLVKTPESKTKVSKKIDIDEFSPINEVRLVGRVTSLAVEKELPSGDKVVEFRVVIGREKLRNGKKEVDSLDIAAWSAKARRAALAVKIDTWVEVKGSVRRRFWRAPTGLASRWQVEASEVVRL